MKRRNLRAAVIGCGRIAVGFDDDPKRKMVATHVKAYQTVRGIDLAAICDVDGEKVKEVCRKRGIPAGYTDYREMLDKEDVDIVSVCTPPATHAPIVIDIAEHRRAKAVFCEKPMAVSVKEARQMLKACADNGILLQIDHQRRFDQMHQDIRRMIVSGAWGKVQQANYYYMAGINNSGSHMFDILGFFFGRAEWIHAYPSINPSGKDGDPNLDGLIKFKSGLLVSFQALDVTKYFIFEMNSYFEKGQLFLKHSGFDAEFYGVGDSKLFSGYKALEKSKVPFPKNYKRNFMIRAVEEIADCLRSGRPSVSSGEDGLAAMELIEMSLKSAASDGKRMKIG